MTPAAANAAIALQLGDLRLGRSVCLGGRDGLLGGGLRGAEIGVGGAIGDALEVTVDEAGVGLGLSTGVHVLTGELHEVVATLLL
jgi:hypothetical protein